MQALRLDTYCISGSLRRAALCKGVSPANSQLRSLGERTAKKKKNQTNHGKELAAKALEMNAQEESVPLTLTLFTFTPGVSSSSCAKHELAIQNAQLTAQTSSNCRFFIMLQHRWSGVLPWLSPV
jgi:hypothetical protein